MAKRKQELPEADYEDGAQTLYFSTKGKIKNVDEEIQQLLRYMEKSTKENAVTEGLKRIHKIVEEVKREEEVELRYMKALERRNMWINKGKEQERVNTERERQKAEREYQRAEQERLRAERAEAEVMKLKLALGIG